MCVSNLSSLPRAKRLVWCKVVWDYKICRLRRASHGEKHGKRQSGFQWQLHRSICKRELQFPIFPYCAGDSFILQSTLKLITCSAICGKSLSWSWTALNVHTRKKILAMTFLLNCQEHTRAFKNVIGQLSTYPSRLFSAVRKEGAVSHSSFLTLFNHSEV